MKSSSLKKKMMIIAAVLAVVLVVVFSSLIVIEAFDHDCCGAHCPICTMVSQCENALREISSGSFIYAVSAAVLCCVIYLAGETAFSFTAGTPVTRKVRIDE